MNIGLAIALIAVALVFGAGAGFLIRRLVAERKIGSARAEADRVVAEAAKKAEAVKKEKLLEAKEEILQKRNEAEAELKERRAEVSHTERRLSQKEDTLDRKSEALDRKNEQLDQKIKENEELQVKINNALAEQQSALEKVAGLTAEEAKEELIERVEGEVKHV